MKGFRSTWIMVAVVGALAGYTFYEYKNAAEDAESERGEHRVFHLLRDDLSEIRIDAKGAETVIQKDGAGWKLLKPVDDLAESSAVEGFLYSLLTQKGKSFQDEKSPKWADFGLDKPGTRVTIAGKGKTETLQVGKAAFDGRFYIRVGDNLWLGDIGLAQLLEREPNGFRSRKVYRGPEDIERIEAFYDYDGVSDTYGFNKTMDNGEAVWSMSPDPGFPVDAVKIASWVQKVPGLSGTDFASEVPPGKPSFRLKIGETEISVSGDIGKDVFISSNKNPAIYKAGASVVELIRVPKIYFRDGKAPFKFNLELVREVDVNHGKLKETFVKKDQSWALKRQSETEELDQEKLVQLFQNISNLEALEFPLGKGAGWPKENQITLRGEGGKALFTMAWGGEIKPRFAFTKTEALRVVRTSNGPDIAGVAKDRLDRLIDSAMIRKKAPENKTAAKTEK